MAISIVRKWKVTAFFAAREVVLWIHNDHIANVLRQVADIQFTENGLEQPTRINIVEVN